MPSGELRWHYRSRHESLIAFSNHRFYDHRLVTFPAALKVDPSLGVEFIFVEDGVYDRGKTRTNSREADEVVELVKEHMFQNPTRSLGVVAFNQPQMEAIQNRIELLRRQHPELERHFIGDRLDGFFVKNLETVQGDERDVMIFSIGYGRDPNGRLTMNFGPLNKEGGERRLNVAITRAREKNIVLTSIKATDFDLKACQARGVLALYHYLDYAERGEQALELQVPGRSAEPDSPLEADVAGAIRELGYEAVHQVGCGRFRIDLGVIDPAEPGRFILGVECDGATYHSAYTARDRDRLRQQVLERLGWRIHRIWSPDWVSRRDVETLRLREAIEKSRESLATEPRGPDESATVNLDPAPIVDVEIRPPAPGNDDTPPSWSSPYLVCCPQTSPPSGAAFHDPAALQSLASMVREVVEAEGPVHIDIVAVRVARRWNLQRVGNRMTSALQAAVSDLRRRDLVQVDKDFLWKKGPMTCAGVRQPDRDNPDSFRAIKHIAEQELQLAIECLVRDAMSIPQEQLTAQVARVFGFDRTGERIRHKISLIIGRMVSGRRLARNGGRFSLAG